MLAVAALLSVAVPAHAGTATMRWKSDSECDDGGCIYWQTDWVTFTAAPGERNDLRLAVRGGRVVLEDRGAPLVAGRGCARLDERHVGCRIVPHRDAYAEFNVLIGATLGDEPDRARIEAVRIPGAPNGVVQVAGGAGDDRLSAGSGEMGTRVGRAKLDGGDGNDLLRGSRFADTLVGGAGADVLTGHGGDDVLTGDGEMPPDELQPQEPVAADVLDGGPGRDRVTYATGPVDVDLADPRPDGHPGEGDRLIGIEDVQASGAAALRGDAGDNMLVGDGPSSQTLLDGRAGDDVLSGAGRLVGGPGNDLLLPAPGASFRCGPGTDTFEPDWQSVLSRVPRACERAYLAAWLDVDLHPLRVAGSALTLSVYPVPEGSRPGTESVNWSDGAVVSVRARDDRDGALLASTHVNIAEPRRPGVAHAIRVPLTAAGVRRLRAGRHTVRVIVWANATRLVYPCDVIV